MASKDMGGTWAWVLWLRPGGANEARRITLWTTRPGATPSVLALEVAPWPVHWGSDPRRHPQSWLDARCEMEMKAGAVPAHGPTGQAYQVQELRTVELRGLSLTALLAEVTSTPEAAEVRRWDQETDELDAWINDEVAWRYLRDARVYAEAFANGKSPAEAVMADRGIGRSAALTRVAKARELGLLTPARRNTAGGALTYKASELVTFEEAYGARAECTDPSRKGDDHA